MAVPHFAARWHSFSSLRPASASSASSPAASAARVAAPIRTRGPRWHGASVVAIRLHIRLNIGRGTGFCLPLCGFWFVQYSWSRRGRGLRGIVICGLQRSLGGLALTGFRILFGALETIAHPLAHVWFVTQLHSAGNLRSRKRTKAASLLRMVVWGGRPRPPLAYSVLAM